MLRLEHWEKRTPRINLSLLELVNYSFAEFRKLDREGLVLDLRTIEVEE